MHPPIDHNHIQLIMVLQHANILQRIAIDKNTVRIIPGLDLAQLVLAHEQLRDARGGGDDALVRREAEIGVEVLEVAGVCAVRGPGEAEVANYKKKK